MSETKKRRVRCVNCGRLVAAVNRESHCEKCARERRETKPGRAT